MSMENEGRAKKTINEWKAGIVLKLTPAGPRMTGNSPTRQQPGFDLLSTKDLIESALWRRSCGKRQNAGRSVMLNRVRNGQAIDRPNEPER